MIKLGEKIAQFLPGGEIQVGQRGKAGKRGWRPQEYQGSRNIPARTPSRSTTAASTICCPTRSGAAAAGDLRRFQSVLLMAYPRLCRHGRARLAAPAGMAQLALLIGGPLPTRAETGVRWS
jgi:hypothetical protein